MFGFVLCALKSIMITSLAIYEGQVHIFKQREHKQNYFFAHLHFHSVVFSPILIPCFSIFSFNSLSHSSKLTKPSHLDVIMHAFCVVQSHYSLFPNNPLLTSALK